MKTLLIEDMVLAKGLTYKEACDLLEKANNKPASKFVNFSIKSSPDEDGYRVVGMPRDIINMFILHPKDWVVE